MTLKHNIWHNYVTYKSSFNKTNLYVYKFDNEISKIANEIT